MDRFFGGVCVCVCWLCIYIFMRERAKEKINHYSLCVCVWSSDDKKEREAICSALYKYLLSLYNNTTLLVVPCRVFGSSVFCCLFDDGNSNSLSKSNR
mmetsp:Transcript_61475/g.150459  ORF Transcript_61475/g.150459 Transcript_61475/m.150459 type:complete len:98 (+) Transcript_61475:421-714(+)